MKKYDLKYWKVFIERHAYDALLDYMQLCFKKGQVRKYANVIPTEKKNAPQEEPTSLIPEFIVLISQ